MLQVTTGKLCGIDIVIEAIFHKAMKPKRQRLDEMVKIEDVLKFVRIADFPVESVIVLSLLFWIAIYKPV